MYSLNLSVVSFMIYLSVFGLWYRQGQTRPRNRLGPDVPHKPYEPEPLPEPEPPDFEAPPLNAESAASLAAITGAVK